MTTARENILNLAAQRPACAQFARDPALHYIAIDCVARGIMKSPTTDLPDQTITAGIGTLVITHGTWTFTSNARKNTEQQNTQPNPPPRPADPELIATRTAICHQCTSYHNGKCTISGCGCSGAGNLRAQFAKCPVGKW